MYVPITTCHKQSFILSWARWLFKVAIGLYCPYHSSVISQPFVFSDQTHQHTTWTISCCACHPYVKQTRLSDGTGQVFTVRARYPWTNCLLKCWRLTSDRKNQWALDEAQCVWTSGLCWSVLLRCVWILWCLSIYVTGYAKRVWWFTDVNNTQRNVGTCYL